MGFASNKNRLIQACKSRPTLLFQSPQSVSASHLHRVRHSSSILQPDVASLLAQASNPATEATNFSTSTTVKVNGFIRTIRKQKRVAFAAIGDGSSLQPLQAVLTPELAEGLSTGTGISITGQLRPSPAGKQQTLELHAQEVQILGDNHAATYPLQKKYHTPEFLRTIPHLRTRLPFNSLLLRLRSEVIAQVSTFFAKRDFVQTHTPIITSSDCEGAGEVFTVSTTPSVSKNTSVVEPLNQETFFRTQKYLTVSSQLHLEALAMSVGKVWTLSPTFRAEKSDTPRHLSEFYMLEAEVAFADSLSYIMDIVEAMLRDLGRALQNSRTGNEIIHARRQELNGSICSTLEDGDLLKMRWKGLSDGAWPRITYTEAIEHTVQAISHGRVTFETIPSFESGLQAEHEKFLAKDVGQGSPVFVTHYPRSLKAFYMSASAINPDHEDIKRTVDCFDLLVPDICELAGGSMREHNYSNLVQSMELHGMKVPTGYGPTPGVINVTETPPGLLSNPEYQDSHLQWYLDLRRFGSVPHGGFGLGFDRLLGYLSGVSNIRDIVAFPRWHGRCDC